MRTVKSWDDHFFELCDVVKGRSKDPSTNFGSVLVNNQGKILGTGYNGFPVGVGETEDRWRRPVKYNWVVHSEINAIVNAACDLFGSTLYVQSLPCDRCMGVIKNAGVKNIVLAFSSVEELTRQYSETETFDEWLKRWNADGCLTRSLQIACEDTRRIGRKINIFFRNQEIEGLQAFRVSEWMPTENKNRTLTRLLQGKLYEMLQDSQ